MFSAAIYGFITGVLLCLTFGTVFFALIQASIQKGYKSGIQIAMGVVASDAVFVFTAIFGTSFLPQIDHFDRWIGGVGIVFLLILAVKNFMTEPVVLAADAIDSKTSRRSQIKYFMKGVALNALNPVNFMSWAAIATYLRTKGRYNLTEMLLFFGMSLIAIGLTESALAVFAHRLRKMLTIRLIRSINIITGIVFIGVAARLFWEQYLK